MASLGWQELLIILVIVALLFGAARVGDLGKSLGRGIREFRQEATGGGDEKHRTDTAPTASTQSSTSATSGTGDKSGTANP